jgi:hypothetical protein
MIKSHTRETWWPEGMIWRGVPEMRKEGQTQAWVRGLQTRDEYDEPANSSFSSSVFSGRSQA